MEKFLLALTSADVPFVRYALIVGLISSVSFGIIGSFVVVKRMSFIAGAVSHTVLGGIGIALFMSEVLRFTLVTPMIGAFVFALLAALVISLATLYGNERLDTVIGAVWAIGMSIGLLFITKTPGYIDPMSYLFGNILLVGTQDIVVIIILNAVIIFVSVVFYNQLLAVSFDKEFAEIRGVNTAFYQVLLIILISLTVLLMITIIGVVMVIALLTIPPAIAGLFTKRLNYMIVFSIIITALFTVLGLIVSYSLKLPTSSVTVVVGGGVYLLSLMFKHISSKSRS